MNQKETEKRLNGLIEQRLPLGWLQSSKPVIFDFRNSEASGSHPKNQHTLYCLFPLRIGRYAIIAEISSKAFIDAATNGTWVSRISRFMEILTKVRQEWEDQENTQRLLLSSPVEWRPRLLRYRKDRRF